MKFRIESTYKDKGLKQVFWKQQQEAEYAKYLLGINTVIEITKMSKCSLQGVFIDLLAMDVHAGGKLCSGLAEVIQVRRFFFYLHGIFWLALNVLPH